MALSTGGIYGGGGFGGDPLAGAGGTVVTGGIFSGVRTGAYGGTPVFVPQIPGGDKPGTDGSREPAGGKVRDGYEEKAPTPSEKDGRPWLKWALLGGAVLLGVYLVSK